MRGSECVTISQHLTGLAGEQHKWFGCWEKCVSVCVCIWAPVNGAGLWAMGDPKFRGQLLEGFTLYIRLNFQPMDLCLERAKKGTGLGCLCCPWMCNCHCWCCSVGPATCICIFAFMFTSCLWLQGIHTQPCYWLDWGTCSGGSLTSLGMPDSANPNKDGISKSRASTPCADGKVEMKRTNKIGR